MNAIILLYTCLAVITAFGMVSFLPPSTADVERVAAYFTSVEIERGQAYAFQRRVLNWPHIALDLAWLLLLVFSPLGRRLADRCLSLARQRWLPAVLLMGLAWFVVDQVIGLPFGVARWALARQWDMSTQELPAWLVDYGQGVAYSMIVSGIVLVGFYLLLRWFPRRWWLPAWFGSTLLAIVYAFLLPIVIEPLFHTFTPLAQTTWRGQEANLRALVARVGVEVGDIMVMDASRKSRHSNAYFTGFGPTRRIVLYDNLLKTNTPAEVESIVAHELGHWLHHHIVQGIVLASFSALVGFLLLAWLLHKAQGRPPLHLQAAGDPAGLPLILLLLWLGTWLSMPMQNAVSRHFERQADAKSLELAGQPDVFIAAEKKLARDNISNVTPHPWAVWLFHTHPPAVERIRMAEEWKVGRDESIKREGLR